MNKKVGIIKRVLCLSLIFLYSVESLATNVSDNDGSAFITKAEFDSLKNNFQAQIDQYNQSIDSKIDSAIASYLSGIRLDEGKKYKLYGGDAGYWNGVRCNKFYLCVLGNGCWHSGTSTRPASSANYWVFDSLSKTDKGFGTSYWVKDLHYGSTIFPDNEFTGYCQCDLHQSPVDADPTSYFVSGGCIWAATTRTSSETSNFITYPNTNHMQDVCSSSLSNAFQQKISVWQPTFTFWKFADAGDVTIRMGIIKNGKNYEEETYGANGTASYWSNDGTVILYKKHGSTLTQIQNLKSSFPEYEWVSLSTNVVAGDEIVLRVIGSSSGNTGTYGIFYFARDIDGWTRDDS